MSILDRVLQGVEESLELRSSDLAIDIEGLDQICTSMSQANVAPSDLGQIALEFELQHYLKIQHFVWNAPRQDVTLDPDRLLVIGGLPRTGTTFLHGALSADQRAATIRAWEATTPYLNLDPVDERRRTEATEYARSRFALAAEISPKVMAMHPLRWDGLEECTPLLQHSIKCLQYSIMLELPGYPEWLVTKADIDRAYELWRRQLALILRDRDVGLVVLKSPMHLIGYKSLVRMYPALQLVHIRRDAVEFAESLLNLTEAARRIYYERVDLIGLGREWLRVWPRVLAEATAAIGKLGTRPLIVDFDQLRAEPERVLSNIYQAIDVECPGSQMLRSQVDFGAATARSEGSYRRLALSEFGIQPAEVYEAFWPYLDGAFLR